MARPYVTSLTLYNIPRSGNSYRVRLMLSLLHLSYRSVDFQMHGGNGPPPELATLNPLREAPVLVDGEVVLRDSQAMLVYLACRYGPEWLPEEALGMGLVMQWLSIAANEIQHGPRMARGIYFGVTKGDLAAITAASHRLFAFLDEHLTFRTWLEGERPTVADVACYPYLFNADEAGLETSRYSRMRTWLRRVEALEGYVPLAS